MDETDDVVILAPGADEVLEATCPDHDSENVNEDIASKSGEANGNEEPMAKSEDAGDDGGPPSKIAKVDVPGDNGEPLSKSALKKKKTPWISPDILGTIKEKKAKWRAYLRTKSQEDFDDYVRVRNLCTTKARKARKLYFEEHPECSVNDFVAMSDDDDSDDASDVDLELPIVDVPTQTSTGKKKKKKKKKVVTPSDDLNDAQERRLYRDNLEKTLRKS